MRVRSALLTAFALVAACLASTSAPRDRPNVASPTSATAAAAAAELAAAPARIALSADQLLATPAAGLSADALATALAQLGYHVLPPSALLPAVRVAVPAGEDPRALARALAATGLLAGVEADTRVHAHRLPDDPLLPLQQPYLDAIRAPAAWDRIAIAPRVTIAVVDSGIDFLHPDLAPRARPNIAELVPNGLDDDANGCVDDVFGCSFVSLEAADPSCGYRTAPPHAAAADDEGHGTFVAGVAAAAGGNAAGGAGVAWNVGLLSVKVLDCTATGRISDAAAGIRYAARAGAQIIVVAFGSATDARVLREAISEATDRFGALIIASSGNDGGRVQFPAAYPGVLGVSGTGFALADGSVDYRRLAPFSNIGPEVDVAAPAVRIVAPLPAAACGQRGWSCIDGQPYARATGTSFAAPLVAGAVALLLAEQPGLGPAFALSLVRRSAAALPARPDGAPAGAALLDVEALLRQQLFSLGLPGAARSDPATAGGPGVRAGPAVEPAASAPAQQSPMATIAPALPRAPLPPKVGHGPASRE
ncbi:MAG: hypothetical protein EXR63_01045 [Dehalococcoidia bacterium]|nr:hypothetical protein [Dehalococcoidia bacterium]